METMETDASSSASQHEATLPDPRPTASEDGIEVGCLHCEHQEAVTKQQNGPSDPEAECLVTAVPVGNPRQVFAGKHSSLVDNPRMAINLIPYDRSMQ